MIEKQGEGATGDLFIHLGQIIGQRSGSITEYIQGIGDQLLDSVGTFVINQR